LMGVPAAANGTLLPSVSPNALVAKRAAATSRAGLRISFCHRGFSFVAELSSSFIGEPLSSETETNPFRHALRCADVRGGGNSEFPEKPPVQRFLEGRIGESL